MYLWGKWAKNNYISIAGPFHSFQFLRYNQDNVIFASTYQMQLHLVGVDSRGKAPLKKLAYHPLLTILWWAWAHFFYFSYLFILLSTRIVHFATVSSAINLKKCCGVSNIQGIGFISSKQYQWPKSSIYFRRKKAKEAEALF